MENITLIFYILILSQTVSGLLHLCLPPSVVVAGGSSNSGWAVDHVIALLCVLYYDLYIYYMYLHSYHDIYLGNY